MADTSKDAFFQIGAQGVTMHGCYGFVRGGGRSLWPGNVTQTVATRGIYFPAAVAGCNILASIDPTSVTTAVSGLPGSGNYVRVVNSDTGALLATQG